MTLAPAPGELVALDGVSHHVVVEGSGGPVVVLESGLGGGVLEWEAVASALRDEVTVVRRDRPGLGWSRGRPPGERTATVAAYELHALLGHLGLAGPYVLVGHSLGGLHVRALAGAFPDDVAGMVLVDPTHEEGAARVPALRRMGQVQAVVSRALLAAGPVGRALLRAVFTRSLAAECAKPVAPETATVLRHAAELARDPEVIRTVAAEMAGVEASCEQVRALRAAVAFPSVPLRVISQGRPRRSRSMTALMREWHVLHEELLSLSSDSAHLVAERSGHLVPLEQPELVVSAVREVLSRPASR